MEQEKNTEILSSREVFKVDWVHIREEDASSLPPYNRILLFKVYDAKRNRYHVTAGYKIDPSISWEHKRNKREQTGYRFYQCMRHQGSIMSIFTAGISKGEDDDYFIVKAWAEMPEENWFNIEA